MFKLNLKKIIFKCICLLSRKDIFMLDILLHKLMVAGESSENKNYAYWEQATHNWRNAPSPIRPSKGDIAIYTELFEQTKHKEKILILGSTPELRDLAAGAIKSSVCLADSSYRIPAKMLAFTNHVDPLRETWIKGDWLDLPLPQSSFNIILGDLVLEQLSPDKELFFLSRMHSLLKKNGVFIGRFHFTDNAVIHKTIDEVIRSTLKGIGNEVEKFLLLKLRLRMLYADSARRHIALDDCLRDLAHYIKTKTHAGALLDRTQRALEQNREFNRTWCPPDENTLKEILRQSFTIAGIQVAVDYEEAYQYPIVVLTLK